MSFYRKKKCITIDKICSNYLGNDEEECTNKYIASDFINKCAFINNTCIDFQYKNCSDYRGTSKEICESIRPYYFEGIYDENQVDPNSRCVYYVDKGCKRESSKCFEATTENDCLNIKLSDSKKMCVFINNQCKEQYASCELYQTNEDTIDQSGCESIVFPLEKCVYTAPDTDGQKGTCTTRKRYSCEFKTELLNQFCSSIILTDKSKYCSFSNNVCSENTKYCLNVTEGATDEICNSLKVSYQTNKCVKNDDKCEEINSFGRKLYLGNLLLVLFWLLL